MRSSSGLARNQERVGVAAYLFEQERASDFLFGILQKPTDFFVEDFFVFLISLF